MPLYDHFHEPLASHRGWQSFHSAWATYVAEDLNERLPAQYFAEPTAQFAIEIDVATWEEPGGPPRTMDGAIDSYAPSAPALTLPFVPLTDVVEVRIFRSEGGPVLAGAVELRLPEPRLVRLVPDDEVTDGRIRPGELGHEGRELPDRRRGRGDVARMGWRGGQGEADRVDRRLHPWSRNRPA